MNVELHIDELVLHGFEGRDRHLIGEAVEYELTRLLTEEGVPPTLFHDEVVPRLDVGSLEVTPWMGANAVGESVARALYEEMAR